jgi:hypothetical protein
MSAASATARASHLLRRKDEIELEQALPDHSRGLTRAVLVGDATGSAHTGLVLVELEMGTSTRTSTRSSRASSSSKASRALP